MRDLSLAGEPGQVGEGEQQVARGNDGKSERAQSLDRDLQQVPIVGDNEPCLPRYRCRQEGVIRRIPTQLNRLRGSDPEDCPPLRQALGETIEVCPRGTESGQHPQIFRLDLV